MRVCHRHTKFRSPPMAILRKVIHPGTRLEPRKAVIASSNSESNNRVLPTVQEVNPTLDLKGSILGRNRLEFLEYQAAEALAASVANCNSPVFPCALIAGDVMILHILTKFELLDKVKVVFVDTLHLFPETLDFLKEVEKRYKFKALCYTPKEFSTHAEYKAVHGVDLPLRDIEKYDEICKVEPFQRALKETECDIMINGRRRDHGAERSQLEYFSVGGNGLLNCQPIVYWEFKDVFEYASREDASLHPLHEKGYPSLGDMHSTLPVDRSKWFEYGMERSGRFTGLNNVDGSAKTECGIHSISGPSSSIAGPSSSIA